MYQKPTPELEAFLARKITVGSVASVVESLSYQCKMLWLGRTEKLYQPEIPLLIEISILNG